MPLETIDYDVVYAAPKKPGLNTSSATPTYPRALALMASGGLDVKPLITDTFAFADSIKAFDFAVEMPPTSVKAQIEMP